MSNELNQSLYNASREALIEAGLPEYLVDAASRIVATDDPTAPNLGRNETDIAICQEVMIQANINSQQ
ncbi:MAG: hypothetical protein KME29_15510 [Calothrix sp. FI2-JRJ7]|jgi:hypothetical protein|nr:hypothetical protein [Calothrix sp. FI2-JRJ7]